MIKRVGIWILAFVFASAPALAQSVPNACATRVSPAYLLVSPADMSVTEAASLHTAYLVNNSLPPFTEVPPLAQTRVLLVDDSGFVTEGGALRPTSRDGFPNDARSDLAKVETGPTISHRFDTFSYTWIPALRDATHYTVMLARLDQNDCVFARVGAFSTR